ATATTRPPRYGPMQRQERAFHGLWGASGRRTSGVAGVVCSLGMKIPPRLRDLKSPDGQTGRADPGRALTTRVASRPPGTDVPSALPQPDAGIWFLGRHPVRGYRGDLSDKVCAPSGVGRKR